MEASAIGTIALEKESSHKADPQPAEDSDVLDEPIAIHVQIDTAFT